MTDQEIIATWMEPSPRRSGRSRDSIGGWWRYCGDPVEWQIPPMWKGNSLGALHEVEARLLREGEDGLKGAATEEGVSALARLSAYNIAMRQLRTYAWHASAEQKIAALAAVLRPIVEAA